MKIREREVHVPVVLPAPGGGGLLGGVGAMFALFGCVLAFALLAMVAVVLAFPSPEYSTVPTTHEPGPCEPFCGLRSSAAPVPQGGDRR